MFHNRLLTKNVYERLRKVEMEPYLPAQVSLGDGGLSYGQAAVAGARIAAGLGKLCTGKRLSEGVVSL